MIFLPRALGIVCLGILLSVEMRGQGEIRELPRGMTAGERESLPFYTPPDVSDHAVDPSELRGNSYRTMAEWEELQAVVITWAGQQAILAEIVRHIQEECKVVIVCSNEASVKNYLTGKGIDWTKNVSFLTGAYNSIWVRDYGPNSIYADDVDSLYLVDWIYNRPRPNDDKVPGLVGGYLGLSVISMATQPNDLVHTGGNFMCDGQGTGFSSNLVLEENGPGSQWAFTVKDENAIDDLMSSVMGIGPYIKMENLPFDGIHHIDMHMKLLDERTLLVGKYPDGIADGPQIEANIQYVLSGFTAASGEPFRVVRIPMPPDASGKYPHQGGHYRTYTNSLIANKTIIVPTYEEKYDTTALRIYRDLMPGYKVTGIDCNSIIPLSGALHCITKEIGVNDPLLIVHYPVDSSAMEVDVVQIDAKIQHREGIASATLYHTTDTLSGFQALSMEHVAGTDQWTASIPAQQEDVVVYYYISAESVNGKTASRPMTAPSGHWNFLMKGQNTSSTEKHISPVSDILGQIYPNPATAITCIPLRFDVYRGPVLVELVDALGHRIPLWEGIATGEEHNVFLQASALAVGTYSVRVVTTSGVSSRVIVIAE